MIALVVVVCLAATPVVCMTVRLPLQVDEMSATECLLYGQKIAGELEKDHPSLTVEAFRCVRVREERAA